MKRFMWVSVISTVLLSACARVPVIDYSTVDAECGRVCQKNETECHTRFADLPTMSYTHCTPELRACVKACPLPGSVPVITPVNLTSDKPSIADRLKLLEELHKGGVITEKEYMDKRQEILKSL